MRDGISMAKAGFPVVVFVFDSFEQAAHAQANGLGVPDLRLYVFPHYDSSAASPELEEQDKAVKAAVEFQSLLLR